MTTGQEVLNRALQMLGYTNSYGEVDSQQYAELIKKSPATVQQVYNELQLIEHPSTFDPTGFSMTEDLNLSSKSINDVMPYGVAMFIAQSEGNGDAQAMFANMYNQKRASVPHEVKTRTNSIPYPCL
jgi:predicted DNA-binding transcriptional regulator YafY